MTLPAPLVSIGLPVYNGAAYLKEALSSLSAQDYGALEILISDNASTDETEEICRSAAQSDPRIRYFRQDVNLGAAPNFNAVLGLASGEYFAWAAHDDIHDPRFISTAMRLLAEDPGAIGAFCRTAGIGPEGAVIAEQQLRPDLQSDDPVTRFRHMQDGRNNCSPFFGLFHRERLHETTLFQSFTGSDRTLLSELLLRGPIVEAPDALFFVRRHPDRSIQLAEKVTDRWSHPREAWFDDSRRGRLVFPFWRRFRANLIAVRSAPITRRQQWGCYRVMFAMLGRRRFLGVRQLFRDIVVAVVVITRRAAGRS